MERALMIAEIKQLDPSLTNALLIRCSDEGLRQILRVLKDHPIQQHDLPEGLTHPVEMNPPPLDLAKLKL